jgi:heme-degrading monooxygenase HmoA
LITVGMYYDVIPEKAELFTTRFAEVVELMKTIPGHKVTYLYQRVDDPYSFAVLSEWEDQESVLGFVRSETFRQVTAWGREQVLRNAPRHKIYPKAEDMGRPPAGS